MKKYENKDNTNHIKELLLRASDFTLNGLPVSIEKIDAIHTLKIEEGDFSNGKYRFTGIARISIDQLSQLYEFKGCASENEITGSININKTH